MLLAHTRVLKKGNIFGLDSYQTFFHCQGKSHAAKIKNLGPETEDHSESSYIHQELIGHIGESILCPQNWHSSSKQQMDTTRTW